MLQREGGFKIRGENLLDKTGLEKLPKSKFGHVYVFMDLVWKQPGGSSGAVPFFFGIPQNACNAHL